MINIGVQKISTIGITENDNEDYFGDVYPNPSSYSAAIDYNFKSATDKLSYEIFDLQGRRVAGSSFEQAFTNGKLKINTEELKSGMYSCRIVANGNSVVRKFSVVH
jgi:hypothetical protein